MPPFLEKTEKKAVVIKIIKSEADLRKPLPRFDGVFPIRETVEIVDRLDWDGDATNLSRIGRILEDIGEVDYIILCRQDNSGTYSIQTTQRVKEEEFLSQWLGLTRA